MFSSRSAAASGRISWVLAGGHNMWRAKKKSAGDLLDTLVELPSCMLATFLCLRQINWYRSFG